MEQTDQNVAKTSLAKRNPKVALVLSILLGFIGIDRLYQGGVKMMCVKWLIVIMTLGVWYIVDWYYVFAAVQRNNEECFAASM